MNELKNKHYRIERMPDARFRIQYKDANFSRVITLTVYENFMRDMLMYFNRAGYIADSIKF